MSQTINQEKTIVNYLLGQLPDNTQEEVEQRFFRDEVYHDYIRAVEDDLIDDYARGELDSATRTQFESSYLSSTVRRQRVFFARAFVTKMDDAALLKDTSVGPDDNRTSWWATLLAPMRVQGLAFQSAVAVLMLALVAAGVWMFIETRRLRSQVAQTTEGVQQEERLREQLTSERQRRDQLEKQLQQADTQNGDEINKLREQLARSDEAASRLRDDLSRLKQSGSGSNQSRLLTTTIASFVLLPGARDNAGPTNLTIKSVAETVNLQLRINQGDSYSHYRVDLAGAAPVLSRKGLRARSTGAGRTIAINIPVKLLQENTAYELTLTGTSTSGVEEVLGYYYFKLVKN